MNRAQLFQTKMNCHECQNWLQSELDRVSGISLYVPEEPPSSLAEHLAACSKCRAWHAAAGLLRTGLPRVSPPPLPPGLADRVTVQVLADRRKGQRRRLRLAGAIALAASIALVLLTGRGPTSLMKSDRTQAKLARPGGTEPIPSIRQTMADAGSAVALLTARTVDHAVDQTRVLLPSVDESVLPPMDLVSLEPPGPSLSEAGQGVSAGLEPVAVSARRAFALFRRELPPLKPEKKPDL
jgi:predicted anti-sigma-YlaC factor YlaD